MKTFTGKPAPLPGEANATAHPVDVVFQLGRTRRFGGWANPEWTVLHHSMLTTMLYIRYFGPGGNEHALLHDAHEYITGDVPTPVKSWFGQREVHSLQGFLDTVIYGSLSIARPTSKEHDNVKAVDAAALIIEAFYFEGTTQTFKHLGETWWRRMSEGEQHRVADIVFTTCPEVYEAMTTAREYNPSWDANPWGVMRRKLGQP